MERILITGASGLLGLTLALAASEDYSVFGTVRRDILRTNTFEKLIVDLLDPGVIPAMLARAKPDTLIHCAALTNLEQCQANPGLAQRLNAEVPALLAAEARRRGVRFVHISTDAVFDGRRGSYTEADEPNPLSVYGHTKLAGERAVAEAYPEALIARVNFYGWSLTGTRSLAEFFYNNLVSGQRINGFTDVQFCPMLVNRLAEVLLQMLKADLHGLYHVVGSQALSKYEFGVALARQFSLDESLIASASVQHADLKAPRSPNLSLQTGKLTKALGYSMPDVPTGLSRFQQLFEQGYPQKLRRMYLPESEEGVSVN